ncbi:hypothetical protein Scinn_54060 [Streptomyces virginiae]|uniref:Uncharacterized protein n=1 Tax=Streptomyces virginiae TaxID=1961 RepID=A0ABQ3NT38_STRVG|nr:hypothetical protein Scinn_54060 [Streptomyces virginiae]
MIGLPMSSLATPDARIRARAPAMLRPWVTVRDLSSGMRFTPHECGWPYGRPRLRIWLRYEATPTARDPDGVSAWRDGRLIPRSGTAEA